MCTVLNFARYPKTIIPETTCPIMVAHAAPAIPISKVKINNGSKIVLIIAPANVQIMEYFGLPSALIRLLPPVVTIRKGNPKDVIPV